MNSRRMTTVAAASLALLLLTVSGVAAVEIGQQAPEFAELPGVDGRSHALADYAEAKAVVVVFTCNHCPIAQLYEDRLIAVQQDYQDKGVQLVAINPNSQTVPDDSLEHMKQRAAGKDLGNWRQTKQPFNFPYAADDTQEVAKAYGATVTPHVFVLDADRTVAYMGAVDNSMNPANVQNRFLRNALDAILAGRAPERASTTQLGCVIAWK